MFPLPPVGNSWCLGSPSNLIAGELKIGFACRVDLCEKAEFYFLDTNFLTRLRVPQASSSTSRPSTCAWVSSGDFGPSLSRGRRELGSNAQKDRKHNSAQDGEGHALKKKKRYVKGADIDRAALTRVYDVATLRVPSDESEELAYKLKGHLLNWPRIKNIARVAGDQLDEDIEKLFWNGQRKEQVIRESVRKAVFPDDFLPLPMQNSGSIENEDLKIRFPHLEALSRPTRAARFLKETSTDEDEPHSYKSNMVEAKGTTRSMWEEKAVVVEIVDSALCAGQDFGTTDSFLGLLEQGRQPRKYQGSTRLLLLDERLAGRSLSELPMALQVVVSAGSKRGFATRELVQTRLKLSYDYWPVDEILQELLPTDVAVQSTFDKLGHIAHLHLQEGEYAFRHIVAQVILDRYKPRIRSVVCDVSSTSRSYGGPQLELLAGNSRLVTSLVRNGTLFKIDLAKGSWPKVAVTGQGTQKQRAVGYYNLHK